ncbi:MAG TPA: hypothetical protein VEO01_19305 [Pseudonocardiaceae bacterium]|nr:hypothetical protein [Pseudonocardiaceae bacterium]
MRPLPPVDSVTEATTLIGENDRAAMRLLDQVDIAMAADLNTPQILAVLQDTLRDPEITDEGRRAVVAACDAVLGLGLVSLEPSDVQPGRNTNDLAPEERVAIDRLIAERTSARKGRDWARADQIRDELESLGVQVTDTPDGPVWTLR